jgi:probable HAF family extracellular repeat protein
MDWKKSLRSLLGRADAGRRELQRRRRVRLGLERLEERCLLSLVDLGTLGGSSSIATSLNDGGQVVGYSKTTSGAYHAFRYDASGIHDLGTLGGPQSEAVAINKSGEVVGGSNTTTSFVDHAFLYDATGMHDLGTLDPSIAYPFSNAYGINDAGQVFGLSEKLLPTGYAFRGFLYDATGMHDLGTLGGPRTDPSAINDAGEVVGWSDTDLTFDSHAFRYDATGMHDLGTLGGTISEAVAINNAGEVVGNADTDMSRDHHHAFRYDATGMHDLGTLGGNSEALGINDAGQVVGRSDTARGAFHAFLSDATGIHDLGTLGGSNSIAWGINDAGQVFGDSTIAGDKIVHTFLYDATGMHDLGTLGGSNSYPADATIGHPLRLPPLTLEKIINTNGQMVGYSDTSSGDQHAFLSTSATIKPVGLNWDTTKDGVDYTYQISSDLSTATSVALYWAKGPTWADRLGSPILSIPLPAGTKAGTYGPINVPAPAFASPPAGATNLLLVTDPDNKLGNFDPTKNVESLAVAGVVPDSLTFNPAGGVDYKYHVSPGTLATPTSVAVYWAKGPTWDARLGTPVTTTALAAGTTEGTYGPINVPWSLLASPPAGATYLLLVTDPADKLGTFDPTKNVESLAIAGVLPDSLVLDPTSGVDYKYHVAPGTLVTPTSVAVYWAKGPTWADRLVLQR